MPREVHSLWCEISCQVVGKKLSLTTNSIGIAWSKLISSKCLNILTMHWQHTPLNSEMIFLSIETLRLNHWFHTQLNIYIRTFLSSAKSRNIWEFEFISVFQSHIYLSVVFNLTTLNWLYIMLILIQVMKMQFDKILKECYFSNSDWFFEQKFSFNLLCFAYNKMIHIDPLFYKQTPKFDLGKSCPVLCYLYI